MATADLTERRQLILKLVVHEFVEKAAPVASETLVRTYDLAVSPATVRNELATLEELGYLTHLHTSAGRIPTDQGYRFFVENLMNYTPLPPGEQRTIRHQFSQVRGDLDQWLQLAATVLARTARNASVVTSPRAYQSRFKHIELISLHETVALMVLVLQGGTVLQQMFTLELLPTQQTLREVSARITEQCSNASIERIEELLTRDPPQHSPHHPDIDEFERRMLKLVIQLMKQVEQQINEPLHTDGLFEMLSQPEFMPTFIKEEDTGRAIECMRQTFDIVTSSKALETMIVQTLASDGVQVIIGGENQSEEMRDYSLVLSRYGAENSMSGVVAVIGPTRMSYPRSISTVRYISLVLSDLLSEFYGGEVRPLE